MTRPPSKPQPPPPSAWHDADVIRILGRHVRPERMQRFDEVISRRMKGLTLVMENLYDPGNRAAAFRSAEAHGLFDAHIIRPEMARKTQARAVSRGAEKWLDIHRWDDTVSCVRHLRSRGYRIAAADLRAARPLHTLSFDRPIALVFGNEHDGITDELRELADDRFIIPMYGFVESFNISVAASISLSWARAMRERATGRRGDLTVAERQATLARYLLRSVRSAEQILRKAGVDPIAPAAGAGAPVAGAPAQGAAEGAAVVGAAVVSAPGAGAVVGE